MRETRLESRRPLCRGAIVWADFGPGMGSEVQGQRPAIVVSNDETNLRAERRPNQVVTLVPLTSNTKQVYSFQVLLPSDRCGLRRDSKAQGEQIRAVAFERIERVIGQVPPDVDEALDHAIRSHLLLWSAKVLKFPSDT